MGRARTYNGLTVRWMRRKGWDFGKTETFVPQGKFLRDLFNFIDYIAISSKDGIIGIQSTSYSNHAARRKKILANPKARTWLSAKGAIYVISWRKDGHRWVSRVEQITEDMFGA